MAAKAESAVSVRKLPSVPVRSQIGGRVSLASTAHAHEIAETAEQPIGDEGPRRDKGDKLDDGLNRNGENEPVLVFGRVDVARAEGHGEGRQDEGDEKGEIAEEGPLRHIAAKPGGGEHGAKRSRDRLELKRDIGQRADHRDKADQRRHPLALAHSARRRNRRRR